MSDDQFSGTSSYRTEFDDLDPALWLEQKLLSAPSEPFEATSQLFVTSFDHTELDDVDSAFWLEPTLRQPPELAAAEGSPTLPLDVSTGADALMPEEQLQ